MVPRPVDVPEPQPAPPGRSPYEFRRLELVIAPMLSPVPGAGSERAADGADAGLRVHPHVRPARVAEQVGPRRRDHAGVAGVRVVTPVPDPHLVVHTVAAQP